MFERFMHKQVVVAHKFPIGAKEGVSFLSAQGKLIGTGPDSLVLEIAPGIEREIPIDAVHHVENFSEIEIPPTGIKIPDFRGNRG